MGIREKGIYGEKSYDDICRDLMDYAESNGFELEIFPADWSLGRKAGPLRNKAMVDVADYAIAFPSGGRGTQSLINFAHQKGIPTKVYPVQTD